MWTHELNRYSSNGKREKVMRRAGQGSWKLRAKLGLFYGGAFGTKRSPHLLTLQQIFFQHFYHTNGKPCYCLLVEQTRLCQFNSHLNNLFTRKTDKERMHSNEICSIKWKYRFFWFMFGMESHLNVSKIKIGTEAGGEAFWQCFKSFMRAPDRKCHKSMSSAS